MKCLLIETNDKRKFFTHEKNFLQLIEFSKTFNAEISIVKIEKGELLNLEELAPAICNPSYKKQTTNYQIIETKLCKNNKAKSNNLKNTETIKKYILNQITNKNYISLKDLKKKFTKFNLSATVLCNHVRRIKKELEKEGWKFTKIEAGVYKCTT